MSRYQAYPEYRDSGSKWVDEIPSNWKVVSLKHILSIPITDGPHSTPEFFDEGIPFVSAEAVSGGYIDFSKIRGFISEDDDNYFSQKYRPLKNDVYMIKSGATTGVVAIVETDERFNIWSPLAVMRCKDTYNPYFLLNYLRSDSFQKSVQISWTFGTQQNIGMGTLENLAVCFPPYDEQQKIANFLDHETAKIDTLIEKQQQLIALLKEKRQAVISHAVTKGLNPDAPMRDSGVEWLGEVPEHWDVAAISSLSNKITNGYVGPTRDIFHESGVRYLQSLHIKSNKIDFHSPYYVSEEWSEGKQKSILSEGDVLVVQTGDIGQVAAVTKEFEGCNCHALIIIATTDEIDGFYLSWLLNSDYGFHSLKSIQTGALHPHLNCSYVKTVKVTVPPENEQHEIVKHVKEIDKKYDHLMQRASDQIVLLQERRTALISAAVTGKIDVRNWEAA